MILSRVCSSPAWGQVITPVASGPRWARDSRIASCGMTAPERPSHPARPHIVLVPRLHAKHPLVDTFERSHHLVEPILLPNDVARAGPSTRGEFWIVNESEYGLCQGGVIAHGNGEPCSLGEDGGHDANGRGNHGDAGSQQLQRGDREPFKV